MYNFKHAVDSTQKGKAHCPTTYKAVVIDLGKDNYMFLLPTLVLLYTYLYWLLGGRLFKPAQFVLFAFKPQPPMGVIVVVILLFLCRPECTINH